MAVVPLNRPVVCPTLIGRSRDLEALLQLVKEVKSGQGRAALVSGEAGIGKSRLLTEVKTYAAQQGFLLLQGNCFQTDSSFPYAPLRDLFFTTLTHFFMHQAAHQPLLCVIEDLHWCDDTTLEFLFSLIRRCSQQPLLFLFTYRSDEVHPALRHFLAQLNRERLAGEFPLSHLSREHVQAMIQAIFALQSPVLVETLDAIITLTEGNPFFIEEILKSLVTTGEIFYAGGRWKRKALQEMSIPQSLQDAVQQRTDRLSPPATQVLTFASVAGRRFDFALLQKVTGCDEEQLPLKQKQERIIP